MEQLPSCNKINSVTTFYTTLIPPPTLKSCPIYRFLIRFCHARTELFPRLTVESVKTLRSTISIYQAYHFSRSLPSAQIIDKRNEKLPLSRLKRGSRKSFGDRYTMFINVYSCSIKHDLPDLCTSSFVFLLLFLETDYGVLVGLMRHPLQLSDL